MSFPINTHIHTHIHLHTLLTCERESLICVPKVNGCKLVMLFVVLSAQEHKHLTERIVAACGVSTST